MVSLLAWRSLARIPAGAVVLIAFGLSAWLATQGMYCLTTPAAPLDVFRSVPGLGSWQVSRSRGVQGVTAVGTPFFGICDSDMLECQLALTPGLRKLDRIRYLRTIIESSDE